MDITVTASTARLLIDPNSRTAFMTPAHVEFTDGNVTGTCVLNVIDGNLTITSLAVNAPDTVDAYSWAVSNMRRVVKAAKPKMAVPIDAAADGQMDMLTLPEAIGAQVKDRKWQRITPEFLEAVARVYKDAEESDLPPTKAVMEHWQANRNRVNEWIRSCRETGLIPPSGRPRKVAAK